jgi:hypothetical protein
MMEARTAVRDPVPGSVCWKSINIITAWSTAARAGWPSDTDAKGDWHVSRDVRASLYM